MARESAHRIREHKDFWRIMRDSTREKSEEAYQEHLHRIVKNKGVKQSPEGEDQNANRWYKKMRTALPKEWIQDKYN